MRLLQISLISSAYKINILYFYFPSHSVLGLNIIRITVLNKNLNYNLIFFKVSQYHKINLYLRPVGFEPTYQRLKVSYFTVKLRSLFK